MEVSPQGWFLTADEFKKLNSRVDMTKEELELLLEETYGDGYTQGQTDAGNKVLL